MLLGRIPPRRGRGTGPDPERRDYGSLAPFSNLDSNGWLL